MNIFRINACHLKSAKEFAVVDPIRARKQLLECLQLLAAVDIAIYGSTVMKRVDGVSYKAAHPNHPITRNMIDSPNNWRMCIDTACGLAECYPEHACAHSLWHWLKTSEDRGSHGTYCVTRKGFEVLYVESLALYVGLMRDYLIRFKNANMPLQPHRAA